jgi:hypothetical protein
MALDSYSNLQTAIGTYFLRTDSAFTSLLPDAITLLEAELQRRLRTREMEFRYTASTVAGNAYLALPTNFGGFRRLEITSSTPTRLLQYVTPEQMAQEFTSTTQLEPVYYTIIGSELKFAPTPDSAYTVEATYYRTFTALSASNTSNWILASHPDAYFYGAMMHIPPEMLDASKLPYFEAKKETAIRQIKDQDQRDRWSGMPLVIRSDVTPA